MELLDAIRSRRSVRAFTAAALDDPTLTAVLEATARAPSAGDLQAYQVVLVRDAGRRRRLAAAAAQSFVATAPAILVFLASPDRSRVRYGERGASLYAVQDATIAAAYAQLAAHGVGLGSVWVGAFDDDAVRAAVDAPGGTSPVALVLLGHPAESPAATPRRPLRDLIRRETLDGPGW